MDEKWGLHPISAGGESAETIGEASIRQMLAPELPQRKI
jgi:hypothetical protein